MRRHVLSAYVNCSLGGMTSVYRARALAEPDTHFDLVFEVDRDGQSAFWDLPNVEVRFVQKNRMVTFINYLASRRSYEHVTLCTMPQVPAQLNIPEATRLIYEIHNPLPETVKRELEQLRPSDIDEIWTPSDWASDLVRTMAGRRQHFPVRTVPNLVDTTRFNTSSPGRAPLRPSGTPVLWIGRLENVHKNYIDFLRVMKLLPDRFYGIMLVSLEERPGRFAKPITEASQLGVEERIDFMLNVAQQDIADLHRAVAAAGGVYCSTALCETFGYGVLEAGLCGVPVVAYDVGPLRDHKLPDYTLVPVGSLVECAEAIIRSSKG